MGYYHMFAIALLGDVKSEIDIMRSVAALLIAWRNGFRAFMVVSGEVALNKYAGPRYDHVVIDARIPLDLKAIVERSAPVMVIEDSRSKERLARRKEDLAWLNLPKAFIHWISVMNENLIVKLEKTSEEDLYLMEVGI